MKTPCGPPRSLDDGQIIQVLRWHQEAMEFRRVHGTLRDLAQVFGVSVHVIRGCFETRRRSSANTRRTQSANAVERRGRPPHLESGQIAFAVAWRNVGRQFRARHGTVAGLARRLGVGASTIHDCIRRNGSYTQRAHVAGDKAVCRASPTRSDDAVRAALLRDWLRSLPKL